jgi:hypothetical protein
LYPRGVTSGLDHDDQAVGFSGDNREMATKPAHLVTDKRARTGLARDCDEGRVPPPSPKLVVKT